MSTPTATAARFPSEYGQTPETLAETLPWDEVAERIASALNYFVATTTDDGRPYLRPVDEPFRPVLAWMLRTARRERLPAGVPLEVA